MKKVCIIIPDGTGIRNYLYSDLIDELHYRKCDVILLHNISKEAIDEVNSVHDFNFEKYTIPLYKETIFQKFLRETSCYARLLHNSRLVNNETILNNWRPNTDSIKKKLFYQIVKKVGSFVSTNYNLILKLEKRHLKLIASNNGQQIELLKKINPDVIFSTHQRAMNALPLINAAHQLNISTIGAIFSWDNVPKARLTLKTEKYVVWSDYMKKELKLYYPEISDASITVTGTPQFEFYKKKKFVMKKECFFSKYKLDTSKRIICFSGDDLRTSPFDAHYLEDIAQVIDTEKLNFQILLRRAPVDTSGRFDKIIAKFPNIIKEATPLWNFDRDNIKNWQIIYPTYKDIELLVSTVFYSDIVLNVGSTMAHDFAMFDKPAIYLNYNAINSKKWNIETIYKFQHFRSMGDLKPVIWLNSKEDISLVLNSIAENEMEDNKKWIDTIAEYKEDASVNIAKAIVTCT